MEQLRAASSQTRHHISDQSDWEREHACVKSITRWEGMKIVHYVVTWRSVDYALLFFKQISHCQADGNTQQILRKLPKLWDNLNGDDGVLDRLNKLTVGEAKSNSWKICFGFVFFLGGETELIAIIVRGHTRKSYVCSISHECKYCAVAANLLQPNVASTCENQAKPKLHHRWWALPQCDASSRAVLLLMTTRENLFHLCGV
jgi:hypothetical protein